MRKMSTHPIKTGTLVETTYANVGIGWTPEALISRQWEVKGTVVKHHNSHGLCYEVKHPDGSIGYYDPSEIKIVS